MHRFLSALCLLCLAALPARAHFVWLLPGGEGNTVRMVFSDSLAPDENADLLARIKQTQLSLVEADGVVSPATFKRDGDAFAVAVDGKKPQLLFGTCRYGVFQRGGAEPALLTYYAKTWTGTPSARALQASVGRLDLDIVSTSTPGTLKVLWKGKPLADTKVYITAKGQGSSEITTDREGAFTLDAAKLGQGLVGLRAGHTVKEAGELDGKKYTSTRHWVTFVLDARSLKLKPAAPGERSSAAYDAPAKANPKENPAASKLLADARAARANWDDFPGFTADFELNVEGKACRGKLDVDGKGKVTVSGVDDSKAAEWVKSQMASVVGHRLSDGTELKTPCAFKDDEETHPLGRAIQVLSGEFHSSYRIRDRQVIVVNRSMPQAGIRFSIIVMENRLNEEKKFLPAHYVVNTWDLKSNTLKRSQSFHHEWTRVGKFDLPATSMIVSGNGEGQLEARKLVLSNHKLK